jgi:hypothetical protein
LEKLFEKEDYQRKDEIQKTRKELEKLELRKSNLQNDLMDRLITPQDYQEMKGRVDKDIILVKDKLTELQQEVSPFKIYIQKEVPMLENLLEFYRKSDGASKRKILGCIFSEKLVLETRNPVLSGINSVTQFRAAEKEELQPVHSPNLSNSSSGLVRFWEVRKKRKRSKMTSCLVWYPERDLNADACGQHY